MYALSLNIRLKLNIFTLKVALNLFDLIVIVIESMFSCIASMHLSIKPYLVNKLFRIL
jgi:hypothetical protein